MENDECQEEKKKLVDMLDKIDAWFSTASREGPFLDGKYVTTSDMKLWPSLHHTIFVARHYLGWNLFQGGKRKATELCEFTLVLCEEEVQQWV